MSVIRHFVLVLCQEICFFGGHGSSAEHAQHRERLSGGFGGSHESLPVSAWVCADERHEGPVSGLSTRQSGPVVRRFQAHALPVGEVEHFHLRQRIVAQELFPEPGEFRARPLASIFTGSEPHREAPAAYESRVVLGFHCQRQ